jgi:hypothetical protein
VTVKKRASVRGNFFGSGIMRALPYQHDRPIAVRVSHDKHSLQKPELQLQCSKEGSNLPGPRIAYLAVSQVLSNLVNHTHIFIK